jgi:GDP-L-fucose synthase
MKVLVTGGSGMVGKNLCDQLSSLGIEVLSPSRHELDLLDGNRIVDFIQRMRPDAVVHCAGLVGGISANISRPYDFAYQNLVIGAAVINSCKITGIEKLINLGSSCMYPKNGRNPLSEDLILSGPLEPTNEGYAIAKISASRLCSYSNKQYGTEYKTLIPCNLFGKYDNFDLATAHLIPGVMHRMHLLYKAGERETTIWGDGTSRREFLLASDLCDFICLCLKDYQSIPEEINVGYGVDFSVREYYSMIAEAIGFDCEYNFDHSKPVGMKQKLVDVTRQTELGWKPPTEISNGISKTYAHFISRDD